MRSFLARLWASVLTGYVLVYYGEVMFWATPDREGMTVGGLLLTWVAYAFFAHVFLAVAGFFRARDGWSVFLAGAVFGWFEEGIVLQTTYGTADGPFPMSLPFTALAWHALIDVGAGWYLMRRALRAGRWEPAAGLCAGLGVFYGLWAIFWWNEPPPPMKALLDAGSSGLLVARFAGYAFATTAVLFLVLWLGRRHDPVTLAPGRWELGILGALAVLVFAGVTVPAAPKALWVMPPLMGVTLWALARNRCAESAMPGVAVPATETRLGRYLLLLLIPGCATALYLGAQMAGIRLRTNLFVYWAFSAAGTGLWLASLVVVFLRTRRAPPAVGAGSEGRVPGSAINGSRAPTG